MLIFSYFVVLLSMQVVRPRRKLILDIDEFLIKTYASHIAVPVFVQRIRSPTNIQAVWKEKERLPSRSLRFNLVFEILRYLRVLIVKPRQRAVALTVSRRTWFELNFNVIALRKWIINKRGNGDWIAGFDIRHLREVFQVRRIFKQSRPLVMAGEQSIQHGPCLKHVTLQWQLVGSACY